MSVQPGRIACFMLIALAGAGSGYVQAGVASGSDCFGDFRYRFEWVDEAGFAADGRASTLLSRLGCRLPLAERWELMAEGSSVLEIGSDRYNPVGDPGRERFPVVADPDDTRLARFSLRWLMADGLDLSVGRHRIKLDNDRFVGNVGWRQNEQTYDSVQISAKRDQWTAVYAYVDRVNRIFDQDLPIGRHDHRSHLLNGSLQVADNHRLVAYLYDIDNRDAPVLANTTVGLRYLGASEWGTTVVDWLAELAHQQDTGLAPIDYSARYFHIEATVDVSPALRTRVGLERLEGSRSPGRAFRTPLATLHAFNGWADRFLTTPDRGLDDLYLGLLGQSGQMAWQVVVHEFRSEAGSQRYGREFDASVAFPLDRDINLLLKAAHFKRDDSQPLQDVTKLWAQLSWAWD